MIETLYEQYAAELRSYVARRVGPELVDDVAQAIWLRAIRQAGAYHEQGAARGWLFAIARAYIVDVWREQRRRNSRTMPLDALGDTLGHDSTDQAIALLDARQRIAAAALTERQRQALYLRYVADLSVAETAARMSTSAGAIKGLCFRAQEALSEAEHA